MKLKKEEKDFRRKKAKRIVDTVIEQHKNETKTGEIIVIALLADRKEILRFNVLETLKRLHKKETEFPNLKWEINAGIIGGKNYLRISKENSVKGIKDVFNLIEKSEDLQNQLMER